MKLAPLPDWIGELDQDDLFALIEQTCADCGETFQTSRRNARCATCASLRTGQVGPATVQCPGCNVEHQIPILAPHKFCPSCAADMEATRERLRAQLAAAYDAAAEAHTRLDADFAHADETDQARYHAAVEARESGIWRGQARPASFFAQQWQAAIARGDGLSPLLRARLAWDDASATLERARAAGEEKTRETLYQLTEARATYGLVVRDGIVVECAPYGRQRWLGKSEQALISAGATLERARAAGEQC